MSILTVIYEKYNLMLDSEMHGDASVSYKYDENGRLEQVEAELVPFVSISKKTNIRERHDSQWKEKVVLNGANFDLNAAFFEMLDTMVVRVSTYLPAGNGSMRSFPDRET